MTIIAHPTLYKRDTNGGTRRWHLQQDGDRYRTVSGTVDGKLAESGWTVAEPKNVGRSNQTTAHDQASAEIYAEYDKKLSRGYFYSVLDIDNVIFTSPMLAVAWEKLKVKPATGYAQPKLDGIRCIARADGLWTRSGKQINSVPHIIEALAPLFAIDPDIIIDGELYNHDLKDDFNAIVSAVRKERPDADELAKAAELIQYHVYDMIDDSPDFYNREVYSEDSVFHQTYPDGIPEVLRLVETKAFENLEQLDDLYARWIGEGYEGQMVRIDAPYEEGKRSKSLIKRKEFITEEFEVLGVDVGNGNWAGVAKKFRLKLKDGREFGAGVRGNKAAMEKLLADADQAVVRWATVRYFALTPDGIPRFPVVIDWGFTEKRTD